MPSFTTILRAIVMFAAGVVFVAAWRQYGPSTAQVQSFTARAVEIARAAWSESQQSAESKTSLAADPHSVAPAFSATVPATAAATGSPSVHPMSADPMAPPMLSQVPAAANPAAAASDTLPATAEDSDPLPELLRRLEELGGTDPRLAAWGNDGQLYRFCCRAALSHTPNLSRHFESVADEPLVAVEEVVAEVEAWRTAQRDRGQP